MAAEGRLLLEIKRSNCDEPGQPFRGQLIIVPM
jgi:hypothetical protein